MLLKFLIRDLGNKRNYLTPILYKIPWRSRKAGWVERMSLTGNNHPIVTRDSRVSRAPPHHIFPAFVDLHGSKSGLKKIKKHTFVSREAHWIFIFSAWVVLVINVEILILFGQCYILINNWKRRKSLIFEKVWNFHGSSKLNKIRIKSTTSNKNHFRLSWRCDVCWMVSKLTLRRPGDHFLHLLLIPTKLIEHPLISQLFSNCVYPAFSWKNALSIDK